MFFCEVHLLFDGQIQVSKFITDRRCNVDVACKVQKHFPGCWLARIRWLETPQDLD